MALDIAQIPYKVLGNQRVKRGPEYGCERALGKARRCHTETV